MHRIVSLCKNWCRRVFCKNRIFYAFEFLQLIYEGVMSILGSHLCVPPWSFLIWVKGIFRNVELFLVWRKAHKSSVFYVSNKGMAFHALLFLLSLLIPSYYKEKWIKLVPIPTTITSNHVNIGADCIPLRLRKSYSLFFEQF